MGVELFLGKDIIQSNDIFFVGLGGRECLKPLNQKRLPA